MPIFVWDKTSHKLNNSSSSAVACSLLLDGILYNQHSQYTNNMYGCQQLLLSPNKELKAILEFICSESNKLTNCAIYYGRQIWFKCHGYLGKFDLINEYKNNPHYQVLHSQVAQQALLSVRESFKSFYELGKKYRKGELEDKPKPPKYRNKGGLSSVSYPKQALKLIDNKIQIPLGLTVNRWFGIKNFSITMPSNIRFGDIKELRILPRNGYFYVGTWHRSRCE